MTTYYIQPGLFSTLYSEISTILDTFSETFAGSMLSDVRVRLVASKDMTMSVIRDWFDHHRLTLIPPAWMHDVMHTLVDYAQVTARSSTSFDPATGRVEKRKPTDQEVLDACSQVDVTIRAISEQMTL
jgi:hypothetical protein